jgi:hypothetical protein
MLKENFCYAICLILGGARVENGGVNSIGFSIKIYNGRMEKIEKSGGPTP